MKIFSFPSTAKIIDSQTSELAVASLEFIKLNGAKQCLMIRGHNVNNPIILYIHGGPGTPELPLIRHYNSELEKKFTVVYWEQRGAGKSLRNIFNNDDLQISQFVDDGYELSKYLIKRFGKEKIFIMGHSWGTIISVKLIVKHPELYFAYAGIGQVVCAKNGEELSYKYALAKAVESKNQKAIKELQRINNPPYLTIDNNKNWYKQLMTERKWLTYFGGVLHGQKNFNSLIKIYLQAAEYSLLDVARFAIGSSQSLKKLWPKMLETNLIDEGTDFKIPIYLLEGKFDYNCPTELAFDYFEKITAPKKEFILFEESAHNPNFEESVKFNNKIIEIWS
jgi:pimeloyl-ACP methyl ester carboxylesterase